MHKRHYKLKGANWFRRGMREPSSASRMHGTGLENCANPTKANDNVVSLNAARSTRKARFGGTTNGMTQLAA